ncbi:MAG: glucose-6-phosphate dehydrogenase assembly protein OpcA [Chloroflexi bacterium]|nr:glucose-6-phosphate dehydrogenase assembly protein OpcA [Chloroflexota bacterium]
MNAALLAGPTPVPVPAIEPELGKLWKSLAPAAPPEGGIAVDPAAMRASLVNLVAIGAHPTEVTAAGDAIGRILSRAPCRAILVDCEPDSPAADITAEISIIGEPPPFGERQVRCEQITLRAAGAAAQNLPAAAIPLYIPDLPVVVWWPGPPPLQHDTFRRFATSADRVLIDSATFGRDGLRALADFIARSRQMRTAVGDLNWARLTPYRQLLAQFFDSAHWREQLHQIVSVTIEARESAGLLMAGWLESRLRGRGYNVPPLDKMDLRAVNKGRVIFHSIVMKCAGGEFAVRRTDENTVEATATVGTESAARTAHIGLAPVEKYLCDEISYTGRDRAFDAAVQAAVA